jgi:hypothetical protein
MVMIGDEYGDINLNSVRIYSQNEKLKGTVQRDGSGQN